MPDSLASRTMVRLRYYKRGVPWYGVLVRLLIDVMSKLGVRIEPYKVFLEGVGNAPPPDSPSGVDSYETLFLGATDMPEIAKIPGRNLSEEQLLRRLEHGLLCLGMKSGSAIVAFTWCNLAECDIEKHRLFGLRPDEASLFDAYTIESFRGRNLAPFMRYRCYEEMALLGRDRCYSVTIAFNTPALKFKQKLGAKVIGAGVFVELLGRWPFHVSLPSL